MKHPSFFPLIWCMAGIVLLAGCTSEPAVKRGSFKKKQEIFQKLKDCSLQLTLLTSRRDFYAGDDRTTLLFSLKNTGLRPVTIYEWHTLEAANIRLYYRSGAADGKNAGEWKSSATHDPGAKNLTARSPLTLNPGSNQAIIQVPAVFLKTLRNPSGKRQPYTLRAVLNLKSVTVESPPVEIYLR